MSILTPNNRQSLSLLGYRDDERINHGILYSFM